MSRIDPALLEVREPDVSDVMVYARLADGATHESAEAEIATLVARVRAGRQETPA